MKPLSALHSLLKEAFLLPVRLYRRFISPLKPAPSCRFDPTCSQYALDAVREWGIAVGSLLALWRLVRCNPFSRGGSDPVPTPPWKKNKDKNRDPASDKHGENKIKENTEN